MISIEKVIEKVPIEEIYDDGIKPTIESSGEVIALIVLRQVEMQLFTFKNTILYCTLYFYIYLYFFSYFLLMSLSPLKNTT